MKNYQIILTLITALILSNCSSKKPQDQDIVEAIGKKTNERPKSLKEKVMSSDTGFVFGGAKKEEGAAFAANNILWRATLKSLDFVPLSSADFAGGVIITDWYSPSESTSSSIKITVKFLSNSLSSGSLEVDSYEKNCKINSFNCSVKKSSSDFNLQIKERILSSARQLSLEKEKKKN